MAFVDDSLVLYPLNGYERSQSLPDPLIGSFAYLLDVCVIKQS